MQKKYHVVIQVTKKPQTQKTTRLIMDKKNNFQNMSFEEEKISAK